MVPESCFTKVLHTNHIPLVNELEELRNIILEPQETIRKLNEEITRLQAQRDELQQFVDGHHALAAPFRRLPSDIWGEIFVHCLPTNKLNVAVCTVKEAPLLLTTVCRQWREITLNTPRLWSSVHISASNPPPSMTVNQILLQRQAAILQGIKLWLERSGSRPLTLSIQVADNPPQRLRLHLQEDSEPAPFLELMDLLVGYSSRWKVLSLGSGVKAFHQRALERLTVADVPLLETVYAGDSNLLTSPNSFYLPPPNGNTTGVSDPRYAPASNFLCKIPSLHSLHLQRGSISTLHISLDWARLTELEFEFDPMTYESELFPIPVLQRIAQTCRSLLVLTLRSTCISGGAPFIDPVDWDSLRELTLIIGGLLCDYSYHDQAMEVPVALPFHSYVKDFYSVISASNLRRLTLQLGQRHQGRPASDDVLPFDTLIKRSPHLTHLRVIGYHILGAEAFSRCLLSAPSLTHLKLQPERIPGRRRRRSTERILTTPSEWVQMLLVSLNELGS